eukprot:827300-Pleurochrysis_carterae.AAC.1
MRSRWERSTRSVAVLSPASSAMLVVRRPRGVARAEKLDSHDRRPAKASEEGYLEAGLVAEAREM